MRVRTMIIYTAIILLCSCGTNSFEIADNYRVYSEDEYGNGYYLMCKLGCDYDAKIEYIKSIKWNHKYIIIEQQQSDLNQWYMIKAKGEKLMCCNGDSLTGSFTQAEIETIIEREKISNLKERKFR